MWETLGEGSYDVFSGGGGGGGYPLVESLGSEYGYELDSSSEI